MKNLENQVIGVRSKKDNQIVAVYPEKLTGTDEEIEKTVRDWYYKQSCEAGEELETAVIDVLTDDERQSRGL